MASRPPKVPVSWVIFFLFPRLLFNRQVLWLRSVLDFVFFLLFFFVRRWWVFKKQKMKRKDKHCHVQMLAIRREAAVVRWPASLRVALSREIRFFRHPAKPRFKADDLARWPFFIYLFILFLFFPSVCWKVSLAEMVWERIFFRWGTRYKNRPKTTVTYVEGDDVKKRNLRMDDIFFFSFFSLDVERDSCHGRNRKKSRHVR